MINESKKNISLTYVRVPRVPSMVVNISFKCPGSDNNTWYTLTKLKKGYPTSDPQFKTGGQSIALCYAIYQKLVSRTKGLYNSPKMPLGCLKCSIYNGSFTISFITGNTATSLKRCVKIVLKELIPFSAWKWYAVNMRNLGGRADKKEFLWAVDELNKSLKNKVDVVSAGKTKLTKQKSGPIMDYWVKNFPVLSSKGKGSKPASGKHSVPEEKIHTVLKVKDKTGLDSMLAAGYIQKTLGIRSIAISPGSILVWYKDPSAKLNSIKRKDRVKRELLAKKDINEYLVYGALESCTVDNAAVKKFIRSKPSAADIVSAVMSTL